MDGWINPNDSIPKKDRYVFVWSKTDFNPNHICMAKLDSDGEWIEVSGKVLNHVQGWLPPDLSPSELMKYIFCVE